MRVKEAALPEQDGEHSTLVGGSTAKLRRLCNASIQEERKVAKEPSSIFADTGSALHHVMEHATKAGTSNKNVLRDWSGVVVREKGMAHDIDLTADLLAAKVLPALDFFYATVPEDAVVYLEKKMPFVWDKRAGKDAMAFPDIEGGFGTGDTLFWTDKRAGGIDWKFGDFVAVTAEDNDQARFYLCCAIMNGLLPVRDSYEFWIFQPAAGRDPSEFASVGYYSFDDLLHFAEDLHDAVYGKPVHVTGAHCSTCKGKLVCPAYRDLLTTAVKTDVEGVDARTLAQWLDLIPSIKAWCSQVSSAALRNAQAGKDIPGYELAVAEGDRTWKDERAAWAALGRLDVPADVRTIKKTISAPQAMDWLKKNGTPEKDMERFAKRHIVRPPTGEKLVKVKDKTKAMGGAISRVAKALEARGLA
jgi:hypothetical protein